METPPPPLSNEKDTIETERLRLEVAQLRRPFWRNPAAIVPVAALFLSLVGNIQQYHNAKADEEKSEKAFALEREKWSAQLAKIQSDAADREIAKTDRTAIKAELQKVNEDISVWDREIMKTQLQIQLDKAEQQRNEAAGKNFLADANRKTVDLLTTQLKTFSDELEASRKRRVELEGQLK